MMKMVSGLEVPKRKVRIKRVAIVISGGAVQRIHSNRGVGVDIIDCDNLKAEGKTNEEIDQIIKETVKNLPCVR